MKKFEFKFFFTRLFLFSFIFCISFWIFYNFSCPYIFEKVTILGNLITTISILIAIIITYLFTKLFSEKTIRVERKKDIDQLAKKVTYLRRLSFQLIGMHEFWKFGKNFNPKQTIDYKYPNLTWEQYRGLDDKNLDKRNYRQISEDIGEISGQAYLALKGLQDSENDYVMFGEFHPYTYKLEEIFKYRDYTNAVWYFFDNSDSKIVNLRKENRYWLNFVDQLYFKIFNQEINKEDYNGEMKKTYAFFESEIFDKLLYLTNLNSKKFPNVLKYSFFNMLIFLLILILSIFLLVLNIKEYLIFSFSIILLSLFIANTIDLIVISYFAIKKELDINEIIKF